MDYAKRILSNFGWKEGDGLGKHNSGIAQPLKASLKFDSAGLGSDPAQEFNNHWWERVFNEAANNVSVTSSDGGKVTMELKDKDNSVEITTKGYSLKKLQKAKARQSAMGKSSYANFLQSSTLTNIGDEVPSAERVNVDEIAVAQFKVLTDEELFQACGGRTAHKGARHGLKLSGKLARLEQQEREILAKMLEKEKESSPIELPPPDSEKKRRKKRSTIEEEPEIEPVVADEPEESKRKKHKKKKTVEAIDECPGADNQEAAIVQLAIEPTVESEATEVKKKEKKKRRASSPTPPITNILEDPVQKNPASPAKRKKKKKSS